MKRILALMLSLMLVLAFAACNKETTSSTQSGTASTTSTESKADTAAFTGKVALVTDVGTIDDESFNQATWEGVKAYCDANGVEYSYFQPTEDSNDARLAKIDEAVAGGYNVVVMPGYLFGEAVSQAQGTYSDVKFIAVDVSEGDMTEAIAANTYCIVFSEEQAGYLAGYATVKDGFTKLGFLGGMAVPAVERYGYGYVQGIDAAAKELQKNVEVKYTYGGQFFGDANITAKMEGWYSNGTEVVFACGGGIYTSALEAAVKYNAHVIGVDVDQHYIGADTSKYSYNPFLTSAMKGLSESVQSALTTLFAGNWSTIGGTFATLGLTSGDYVGIPTEEGSWEFKTFTVEDYNNIKGQIVDGTITVSNDISAVPEVSEYTTVNVID